MIATITDRSSFAKVSFKKSYLKLVDCYKRDLIIDQRKIKIGYRKMKNQMTHLISVILIHTLID